MKGVNNITLFRKAIHAWLVLFLLSCLPVLDELWLKPISPDLPAPSVAGIFTHVFNGWAEGFEEAALAVLFLLSVHQLLRPKRSVFSVLIWILFTSLMNKAWLASSGGQQLISNMLFWLIFLPDPARSSFTTSIGLAAFWIIRLQLLLAYAATALHKLTGDLWLSGDAIAVIASDPLYGPEWLLQWPLVMIVITWAALLFQITFPLAVWWPRTKIPWMIAGVIFHLVTAFVFRIPEMALAFVLCYTIWLDERELELLSVLGRKIKLPLLIASKEHPHEDLSGQAR
jgi:hypothetical protein